MEQKNYKSLNIISQGDAIKRANKKIYDSMRNKYPGLICRWDKVNKAFGGSFRFNEIGYICGPSGSGKSFILNMLREDFAGNLNRNYPYGFKILAFSFEMSAEDEVIRTYSSSLKTSYSELVSANKKISEEYYNLIKNTSSKIDNDKIFYVETTGNRDQILKTVNDFANLYPEDKLIVTIDHSLLMEYLDEKSEIDLINQMSRLALKIKKTYGAMVLMLGQLNDKMEQPERIKTPQLQYPTKTDIHGGKSIYMVSDTVVVINRPELLQIEKYGPRFYPTKDLVVWHFLKSRLNGNEGIIRMKQDFAHGTLSMWEDVLRINENTLFSDSNE